MKEQILKSNKFWIIVLGVAVLASSIVLLLIWRIPMGLTSASHAFASHARIYKDGDLFTAEVNLLSVNEPFSVVIDGGIDSRSCGGGLNVIDVEHGRIRMAESDCTFNICVHRGWVRGGLMPIVCLPNRVVVTFDGGSSDIDAEVG